MRKIIISLFWLFFLVGCNHATTESDTPKPIIVQITQKTETLPEKVQKRILAKVDSEWNRNVRVEAWQKRSMFAAIGFGIIGLLLILPSVLKMFGKVVPAFYSGGLSLLTSGIALLLPKSNKKVVEASVWRWGLWSLGFALLFGLISYYMDEVFSLILYTCIVVTAGIVAAVIWEISCFYYTRKLDLPFDGIKP